jgi:hypothetical protein
MLCRWSQPGRRLRRRAWWTGYPYPSAPGTHSTVTVLGGSGRGLKEGGAAALSSGGFTALALCYFGLDAASKVGPDPAGVLLQSHHLLMALLAAFGVAHDSDTR